MTLTPCPVGVDYSSGAGYDVYIDDANPESVPVISGSSDGNSCSIVLATFFPHSKYTIGSASSGIQETINATCGISEKSHGNGRCTVLLASKDSTGSASVYDVRGTIFFHANNSSLDGYGVFLNCLGRASCLQVGDLSNSNNYSNDTVAGLNFVSSNYSAQPPYAGINVKETTRANHVVTITTASPHGFRPGDKVTIMFTDNSAYWGDALVATVPTDTSFTYSHAGGDIERQLTPGVAALAYTAVLDNSNNTHFIDITNNGGWFNNFFDMWDDENATIDHFENAAADLNHGEHWSGSFVFSAGNQGAAHQIAPVISLLNSTITSSANGATVYNSNGLYIENTVMQGTSLWQVHTSNETGNYQGAYLKNIYSESTVASNPVAPARSPFPGLGIAGLIAGGGSSVQIAGGGGVLGAFPSGGVGSTRYSYFIVANDITAGTQTSPMQILDWLSTGKDSIPVRWPRIANGSDMITYDVLRIATPVGVGAVYPYSGGCPGGDGGTCGYVAKGLSQATACAGRLVCTYVDSAPSPTHEYMIKIGTYSGNLSFWPGSVVSVRNSIVVDNEEPSAVGIGLNGNPLQIASRCSSHGVAAPGGYTVCLASITIANNSMPNQTATIVTDGPETGGGMALSKGRLNFSASPFSALQPHHIITLIDSQPALTRATSGFRPPAGLNDTWIGTDVPQGGVGADLGRIAFGAPISITNYIRATGDGVHANWLERLTADQKVFAVPVKITPGNSLTLGNGSPVSQINIYKASNVPATPVPPESCVDMVEKVAGLVREDQISGVTPPQTLGNLSLNAYARGAGEMILHFCNSSRAQALVPSGTYSFLSIH